MSVCMCRNVIPPDDPRPRPLSLVSWDREHVKVSGCGPLRHQWSAVTRLSVTHGSGHTPTLHPRDIVINEEDAETIMLVLLHTSSSFWF